MEQKTNEGWEKRYSNLLTPGTRIMAPTAQEAMSTHNTREGIEDWKEEFWYKIAEWNTAQPEDIDIYANQLEMLIEYHIRERVHQELQKAREEEREKWESWVQHDVTCYLYTEEGDSRDCTCGLYHAYQSELDQPK